MPANVVKSKRDERLWEKAKKGKSKGWDYVMGTFQRMKGKGGKGDKASKKAQMSPTTLGALKYAMDHKYSNMAALDLLHKAAMLFEDVAADLEKYGQAPASPVARTQKATKRFWDSSKKRFTPDGKKWYTNIGEAAKTPGQAKGVKTTLPSFWKKMLPTTGAAHTGILSGKKKPGSVAGAVKQVGRDTAAKEYSGLGQIGKR